MHVHSLAQSAITEPTPLVPRSALLVSSSHTQGSCPQIWLGNGFTFQHTCSHIHISLVPLAHTPVWYCIYTMCMYLKSTCSIIMYIHVLCEASCIVQYLPFRQLVVVVSLNDWLRVLETNVVEASKRRSVDVGDAMVWDQEQLLCTGMGQSYKWTSCAQSTHHFSQRLAPMNQKDVALFLHLHVHCTYSTLLYLHVHVLTNQLSVHNFHTPWPKYMYM